jgi:hypothetical protein
MCGGMQEGTTWYHLNFRLLCYLAAACPIVFQPLRAMWHAIELPAPGEDLGSSLGLFARLDRVRAGAPRLLCMLCLHALLWCGSAAFANDSHISQGMGESHQKLYSPWASTSPPSHLAFVFLLVLQAFPGRRSASAWQQS